LRPEDNTVLAATHGRGLIYTSWDYNPSTFVSKHTSNLLKIFPNPARDFIQIDFGSVEHRNVEILNNQGRLVFEGILSNKKKISISNWTSGIYYIKVGDVDSQVIGKLVVQ
jgi:hypothetical protein